MIVLLALIACATGSRWTENGAFTPTLARMDADHDGTVSSAEYEALRFRGPDFKEVDTDGDGALSVQELHDLVLAKDPTSLSPTRPSAVADANKRRRQAKSGKAEPTKVEDKTIDPRQLKQEAASIAQSVMLALKEEIHAVAPNQATPTDDAIKAAAGSADLRTVESRAILLQLETASDAVGVPFPNALRAATLASEPIVASADLGPLPDEKPRVQLGRDGNPIPAGGTEPAPGEPGSPGGPPLKPNRGLPRDREDGTGLAPYQPGLGPKNPGGKPPSEPPPPKR